MRALIQRVDRAEVRIESRPPASIARGLLIYLGVGQADTAADAAKLAAKIANLRIFSNADGKFDLSILDVKGEVLVISQFTLYGNAKGGRRPDFTAAAAPALATPLYEGFIGELRKLGLSVKTGEFGAMMKVESINDGPVTIWLDTSAL